MLNVLTFLLQVVRQYTIWVYVVCGLVILWNVRRYLLANRDRRNTIFPVEREVAAHREGQAMSVIGAMLAVCALVFAAEHYVLPGIDVTELVQPTPTMTLAIPTLDPTATPIVIEETPTPRATSTTRPTTAPQVTVPPTNTPPPPAPAPSCPDPNTCITSPRNGETVSGTIAIRGTANHAQFQFYKIELGIGTNPDQWSSIGQQVFQPRIDGQLMSFNTGAVPNGTYSIRLVVVDITGNYPPPFAVTIDVEN